MNRIERQAERDQFFRWADKNKTMIEENYRNKNMKFALEKYMSETRNKISLVTLIDRIKYVIDVKLIRDKKRNETYYPRYKKESPTYVERICPKCHKKYKTRLGRDGLPLHNRCSACKTAELRYRT